MTPEERASNLLGEWEESFIEELCPHDRELLISKIAQLFMELDQQLESALAAMYQVVYDNYCACPQPNGIDVLNDMRKSSPMAKKIGTGENLSI